MTDDTPKLLVLGGPSSGKTTYRTQLYQRVENTGGELRLIKSVGDRTALQGDVDRLVQGLQPMHTPLKTYHSTTLLVGNRSNREFALEFADYEGEQISKIADSNVIPPEWVERSKGSSNWLFFLRIDQIRNSKSFMTDPVDTTPPPEPVKMVPGPEKTEEIQAIETLQRLLFVRGTSLRHRLTSPRLGVLLSCWDEMGVKERQISPQIVLATRAPLFAQFLASNWAPPQLKIWGLSSTEEPLPESIPNVEFAKKGPENIGYVVTGADEKSSDLTIPINWLLEGV